MIGKLLKRYFLLKASQYDDVADFYSIFPIGSFGHARENLARALADLFRSLAEAIG